MFLLSGKIHEFFYCEQIANIASNSSFFHLHLDIVVLNKLSLANSFLSCLIKFISWVYDVNFGLCFVLYFSKNVD
jgi:hypothetical protein